MGGGENLLKISELRSSSPVLLKMFGVINMP
jgi:hypothetical protein